MKNAYVIGHITVKDEDKWSEYRSKVPATLDPWGAELVLRGELCSVLSGSHGHTDTVVIRFPDLRSLKSWHSVASNAVLPGWVRTPMAETSAKVEAEQRGVTPDKVWAERAVHSPAGRVVTPEEVAEVIAFLASEESSGVNGEAITVALGGIW
jgi:uncharacterized protein (DUF1330 family)